MSQPLFSLFIPQMRMPFTTIVERVRAAEANGFDGVALMDHLAPPALPANDVYDCFVTAAAIATATTTVAITPLVTCASFRHPAVLAKMVVSLDHLSNGRFELGIGWGSVPDELNVFGIYDEPPAVRSARLGEQLAILEQLFTGEPFDHSGRFYTLRNAQQHPRPLNGRIPILIGGAGPKLTMPLVARYADWWNLPSTDVHRIDELRALAGNARISTQHVIGLAPTSADLPAVEELTHRRFGNWYGLITGTPDQVADQLIALARNGVERFFLPFSDFAPPETLALFGREVVPAVRDALASSR
jgi:alkanesulfonate monooxygenase SsuD/methylene tetrahydromethanopterin reductase-like flavin-dependent oxidoreductase (luciferase family)